MTGLPGSIGIDIAALQQIIEAADAVPAVAIGLEQQRVPAALVGAAVVLGQEIDQQLAGFTRKSDGERDLARLLVQVMDNRTELLRQS